MIVSSTVNGHGTGDNCSAYLFIYIILMTPVLMVIFIQMTTQTYTRLESYLLRTEERDSPERSQFRWLPFYLTSTHVNGNLKSVFIVSSLKHVLECKYLHLFPLFSLLRQVSHFAILFCENFRGIQFHGIHVDVPAHAPLMKGYIAIFCIFRYVRCK